MRQTLPPRRLVALSLWPLPMIACAMLGGGGGGSEALPDRGIAPYHKAAFTSADAPDEDPHPYVLRPENPLTNTWEDPSAVVDQGRVCLYFTSRTAEGSQILRAVSDAEGIDFDPPTPVWDDSAAPDRFLGQVSAPSVVREGDTWWMAFAFGGGEGIGLAQSDDGLHFELVHEAILTPDGVGEAGVGSPSLLFTPDGPVLYYEAWSDAGAGGWIARATGDAQMVFARDGAVLTPGTGCTDISGEEEEDCWDATLVGAPEVRLATTATGRTIYRLWFHGRTTTRGDLGFAAAWDGIDFSRFIYNPVLGDATDERMPTNVRLGDRYLLYYVDAPKANTHGIAVAWHDADNPTSTF